MKIKKDLFSKSFFVSLIIFAVIGAIIITNLYINRIAIEPDKHETNLLIGLTHNGKLLSMSLLHCDPQNNSITFLAIPDNTLLSNDDVLQNQFKSVYPTKLIDSVERLTGTIVHRYYFLSVNALSSVINSVGNFDYLIRYPFISNGTEHSGSTSVNGDLVKAMFLYDSYDMTKVSLSVIGESLLKNFLSAHGSPQGVEKISEIISTKQVTTYSSTNLEEDEISKYCSFFSEFSSLTQYSVAIEGEYLATSSSVYFRPLRNKANKNIFK